MTNLKNMDLKKRIAIVAQENKKTELIEWSYFNKNLLMQHEIIAEGKAGDILEGTLNIPVLKLAGGPMGGYRQLASMISEGEVDILVFFWNAETLLEENDIKNLLHTAVGENILIAYNIPSADFIFASALMDKKYPLRVPELSLPQGK